MSKWISVKEKLPERVSGRTYSQVPCIVYHDREIRILVFNHEHMCWDQEDGDDHCCNIEDVSHWMPLPDTPEAPTKEFITGPVVGMVDDTPYSNRR